LWSNSEVDIRDISSLESRQTWSVASRSVATSRSISRQTYGDLYSPDGRFAILGHQWWNISEQREIDAVDEHRNVIAFSKDGRNAMSTMPGHPFESLKLWEVDTGRTIGSSPIVGRSDRYSATVSPDGTFALLGEGNRLTFISETGKIDYLSIGGLDEQYGSIESLTISPNSALAATAHRRNDRESVAIWDLTEFHQA
jgi:WD40 repeat protein